MSDTGSAPLSPPNAKIATALKRVAARIYQSGDLENLTVKRVRKAAEHELDLSENWFKEHEIWSDKSKSLITSEVERLEAGGDNHEAPAVKAPPKANSTTTSPASRKRKQASKPDNGITKKSKAKPRKKRKVSSEEEDEVSEVSEGNSLSSGYEHEPQTRTRQSRTHVAVAAASRSRSLSEDEEDDDVSRRSANATAKAQSKSRRAVVESDDDNDDRDDDVEMAGIPTKNHARIERHADEEDEEQLDEGIDAPSPPIAKPTKLQTDGNDSESSLSSLLDEPPKKKRQKNATASKPAKSKPTKAAAKSKTTSTTAKAKKADADRTPDDEELTRLKGWLLKCGVRKVWGKELAPYETPKAKIAHLKSMLADVGLTGRYSVEKARQIKEQRELAADLEDVTAFESKWGSKEEARPKRKGDLAAEIGLDPSLVESEGSAEGDW